MPTNPRKPNVACPAALRRQIDAAILEQLSKPGRLKWDELRERPEFAHMVGKAAGAAGRRKFFNWVKKLRQPIPADRTRPHLGRETAEQSFAQAEDWARRTSRDLPAPAAPSYRMRVGAKADRKVDLIRELGRLFADAERMREEAMTPDPGKADGWRIGDPKMFEASIRLRLAVTREATDILQDLCDLSQLRRYPELLAECLRDTLGDFPDVLALALKVLKEAPNSLGLADEAGMLG